MHTHAHTHTPSVVSCIQYCPSSLLQHYRVLVGAPKADSVTFEREGGAFSCPLVNGGTCQFEDIFQSREGEFVISKSSCRKLLMCKTLRPFTDANPEFFKPPLSSNPLSNMDQLLGYSLRSFASGRVAVSLCSKLAKNIITRK